MIPPHTLFDGGDTRVCKNLKANSECVSVISEGGFRLHGAVVHIRSQQNYGIFVQLLHGGHIIHDETTAGKKLFVHHAMDVRFVGERMTRFDY